LANFIEICETSTPSFKFANTMNQKQDKETLQKWHSDPNNWKWGLFYFNKEDKRIFPPKRIPQMGWTVNFANPWSIITLIVIIGTILFLSWQYK
jgi:uncharacterized membrane protein